MNFTTKTICSLMIAFFALSTTGLAQKFAHINSQQLLLESPKVKTADSQLETYQNELITKGQAMVNAFETEYAKYVKEVDADQLSPLQMQQRESALGTQQEAIQKYELEVQQKLAMKREELYKPILDEVKAAIDAIGKEGSYTMIFDTATNGLLFAEESEDLLSKVKAKLGW